MYLHSLLKGFCDNILKAVVSSETSLNFCNIKSHRVPEHRILCDVIIRIRFNSLRLVYQLRTLFHVELWDYSMTGGYRKTWINTRRCPSSHRSAGAENFMVGARFSSHSWFSLMVTHATRIKAQTNKISRSLPNLICGLQKTEFGYRGATQTL